MNKYDRIFTSSAKNGSVSAVSCGSLQALKMSGISPIMIKQELEYRLLKILDRKPDLTQRQLAKELGISLGKTHYLIKSLIDVGWVKLDNFQNSDNKWGYAYLLTPKGIVEKTAVQHNS